MSAATLEDRQYGAVQENREMDLEDILKLKDGVDCERDVEQAARLLMEKANGGSGEAARELGMRVLSGTVASGDQFISDGKKKAWIRETFGALACEMEGAAIAHVCFLYGVRCGVIRTISDRADGKADVDFPTFAEHAAALNAKIVRRVLPVI